MFLRKAFVLAFMLPFFLCSILEAQEVNLSNSSVDSLWPAIAVNSRGDIMVVWTEEGSAGEMWYRIFRDGTWSPARNSNIVHEKAWSNRLDVDSAGTFHVTYADGYGSRGRDIWYSYYTGSGWATAERTYRSEHNSAWNWMSIDTNDDIHVMWYHKYLDSSQDSDIITMRKPKGGSWPSSYDNVSRSSSSESIHPAFRVMNGNIYAVYMDGGSGNRKLTFTEKVGGSWGSRSVLDSSGYYPAMCLDNSGNVYIAYGSRSGNYFVVSRTGGNWNSKQVVSGGFAPLQFGDIRQRNGVFVTAFVQKIEGKGYVYYAAKFGENPWSKPVKISSGDSYGDGNKHVQVIVDYQGYAHFLWEGGGVGGKADIYYTKVKLVEADFPFIEVDKYYLAFQTEKGDKPQAQSLAIRNSGKGTFDYTVSTNRDWLTVNPAQGTAADNWDLLVVNVDPGNRGAGKYNGIITISSKEAANSPVTINVELTIEQRKTPHIQLNRTSLDFWGFARGNNPESQEFKIRNSGQKRLDYQIISMENWIDVSPKGGSSSGEWDPITVFIDNSALNAGLHTGQIHVKDSAADNSPQILTVTLKLDKPPIPYSPLNPTITKLNHEGLFIKAYKNRITWQANPKNEGLFNIAKYRIYRRETGSETYEYAGEVDAGVFFFFDRDFSSAAERDKYTYGVSCVDEDGKESNRTELQINQSKSNHTKLARHKDTGKKTPN